MLFLPDDSRTILVEFEFHLKFCQNCLINLAGPCAKIDSREGGPHRCSSSYVVGVSSSCHYCVGSLLCPHSVSSLSCCHPILSLCYHWALLSHELGMGGWYDCLGGGVVITRRWHSMVVVVSSSCGDGVAWWWWCHLHMVV